ncbi:MAG: type II toxin-antitoxin system HipA family toxin [Leadbetterella sp.]|nr:type II toxin-antitoxin system HipA family toxin [Leadbetterella sp.]
MVNLANVILWDKLVGAVLWDEAREVASFEMDAAFVRLGLDIAPLTMPLQSVSKGTIFQFAAIPKETYQGLPGLLADALPDRFGGQLIDIWLASQGRARNSMNPVERLCYQGSRGMGALEFAPAIKQEKDTTKNLEIGDLVALSKKALELKTELNTAISQTEAEALMDIVKVGTSAGGARAKAVIAYNPLTKEVRSGQVVAPEGFEHWLIKFDGVTNEQLSDPKGYGRIEFAYYKMAIACGINMTESKLLEEGGRAHFMTKRFDRLPKNQKLHMQTLCGLCHYDYNNPNAYAYEQAFQAMRELRLPYTDAEQLYLRMVFNVIARNQDDHTKNISFLMDNSGKWKLSPAYDVTYAYNPENKWIARHQMSVNGKREGIDQSDLLNVAKQMNIKKPKDIIAQVKETVSNWKHFAQEAQMPERQALDLEKTFLLGL